MKSFLFLCCSILFLNKAGAQHIKLIADERILLKYENQKLLNNPEAKHNGFRFQIYQGSSRTAAYAANSDFMLLFPGVASYVVFEPPSFKVRVGDFRFKFEALAFKEEMLKQNLTGFFIVHDKIIVPKPK
jgi:hypothetical protein